jgi:hypothetical protein
LAIVVDLPSCSVALVTMITFASLPSEANSTFVRNIRNARPARSTDRRAWEAVLGAMLLRRLGQARQQRQLEQLADCSAERTRVSSASRRNASPIPRNSPKIEPRDHIARGRRCASASVCRAARTTLAFAVLSAAIVLSWVALASRFA